MKTLKSTVTEHHEEIEKLKLKLSQLECFHETQMDQIDNFLKKRFAKIDTQIEELQRGSEVLGQKRYKEGGVVPEVKMSYSELMSRIEQLCMTHTENKFYAVRLYNELSYLLDKSGRLK